MEAELIDVEELARRLSIPQSRVYAETRKKGPGTIPVIRIGRYCRFQFSQVLEYFKERNQNGWNG